MPCQQHGAQLPGGNRIAVDVMPGEPHRQQHRERRALDLGGMAGQQRFDLDRRGGGLRGCPSGVPRRQHPEFNAGNDVLQHRPHVGLVGIRNVIEAAALLVEVESGQEEPVAFLSSGLQSSPLNSSSRKCAITFILSMNSGSIGPGSADRVVGHGDPSLLTPALAGGCPALDELKAGLGRSRRLDRRRGSGGAAWLARWASSLTAAASATTLADHAVVFLDHGLRPGRLVHRAAAGLLQRQAAVDEHGDRRVHSDRGRSSWRPRAAPGRRRRGRPRRRAGNGRPSTARRWPRRSGRRAWAAPWGHGGRGFRGCAPCRSPRAADCRRCWS